MEKIGLKLSISIPEKSFRDKIGADKWEDKKIGLIQDNKDQCQGCGIVLLKNYKKLEYRQY